MTNLLYYGDNLDVLRRHVRDETVDLVYLDPPFKSNQDYNVLFAERDGTQSAAQIKAFTDTWTWDQGAARSYAEVVERGGRVSQTLQSFRGSMGDNDMMAYLSRMAPRLLELHRVLNPTGSIYLHCDPTASHYLKILMDSVFDPRNFRNEIIWKRTFAHGSINKWGNVHDTILFYSKTDDYNWTGISQPYEEEYLDDKYRFKDERGRYRLVVLTGPGRTAGDSGKEWRGYNPTSIGRHWAVPQKALEQLRVEGVEIPESLHEQLELLFKKGYIRFPEKKGGAKGVPEYKLYLSGEGSPLQDVILDVSPINSQAQERLGYPTQKPEALLERLIKASSDEGDLVLDPFCGCGTAVAVAQKTNRKWIGIDITHLAITLIRHRLQDTFGESIKEAYKVIGEPVSEPDAETLAATDPYQFQWWALGLVGARPVEQKKGADRGIDGRRYFFQDPIKTGKAEQIVMSVKAGIVTVSHVRDLRGVVEREKAAIGVLISLNRPTQPMVEEAVNAGFYTSGELGSKSYPRIQLLTVGQLLSGKTIDCPPFARGGGDATFNPAPRNKVAQKEEAGKQVALHEHIEFPK